MKIMTSPTKKKYMAKKKNSLVNEAVDAVSVVEDNNDIAECKALLIRLTVAVEELLQIIRLKKPITAEELVNNGR